MESTAAVSNQFVRLVAGIVIAGLCAIALTAQDRLDRVVATFPNDQAIQLQLPPTSFWFEQSLDRIASSTQVLMGVESIDDDHQQPAPTDPRVVLSGRTFGEAVTLLVRARPGYSWSAESNIVHVFRADRDASILARHVDGFSIENVNAAVALRRLCQALRPPVSGPQGYLASGPPPSPLGQRLFTVPATTGTLLEVLDAIAERHGGMIWHVTYPNQTDRPQSRSGVAIGFVMFDGWGTRIDGCAPA